VIAWADVASTVPLAPPIHRHPERSAAKSKDPEEFGTTPTESPLSATTPNPRCPRRTWYPQTIANVLKSAACVNLAVFERMVHPPQPDLADISNFLLLQYPLALCTAIHATPLIAAIHATIPGARVSAAASGVALEVLRNNPGLETLIPTPSPLQELLPAANAIRRAKPFGREPYAVLLTTGNEGSRIILAAVLSGSPTRVGFTFVPELAAAHLHVDPRLSQIANNLRILEVLGHGPALLDQLQANPALLEPSTPFPQSKSH
jgi:hypothetical protein